MVTLITGIGDIVILFLDVTIYFNVTRTFKFVQYHKILFVGFGDLTIWYFSNRTLWYTATKNKVCDMHFEDTLIPAIKALVRLQSLFITIVVACSVRQNMAFASNHFLTYFFSVTTFGNIASFLHVKWKPLKANI